MAVDLRAHRAVQRARETGRLTEPGKLRCADCAGQARLYHHESYEADRWLDVVALCAPCHQQRHLPERRAVLEANGALQRERMLRYWRERKAR